MSFDTPSTKLSSDPSGQHLDIGTWSFGGAFTLSTWIKADEWRNKYSVLHLPGSAALELRSRGVSSRELYLQMDGTSGGTENISSGAGLLEWGKWIHLGIALQNGGTNNSTGFVYKNGSLFTTVTGMSLPNIVSRSHSTLDALILLRMLTLPEIWTTFDFTVPLCLPRILLPFIMKHPPVYTTRHRHLITPLLFQQRDCPPVYRLIRRPVLLLVTPQQWVTIISH